MPKPIELTTTINPHAFPRLYVYLQAFESGRPRASVLKRLAEDYLHSREQADGAVIAQPAGPSDEPRPAHGREDDLSQTDKAVANSLRQFGLA
jgi:hypothetical protein